MTALPRILRASAAALALFAYGGVAIADVTADLRNPSVARYTGPPVGVTTGQFGGFAPATSVPNTGNIPDSGQPAEGFPTNGTLRLTRSYLGYGFTGNIPRYLIGDVIAYPLVKFDDEGERKVPLRRKPLESGEGGFLYLNPGDDLTSTPQTFSNNLLIAHYHWSPHAELQVGVSEDGEEEELLPPLPMNPETLRSGFVYASRPGTQVLFWRTENPLKLDAQQRPIYGVVRTDAQVASGASKPPRRIFWTENGFNGPAVPVPLGEIQQVHVAYTEQFPQTVAEADRFIPEGSNGDDPTLAIPITRNTLWFNSLSKSLNAYNLEGRVLVEFLGETRDRDGLVRRQVGIEIVDVIREPAARNVDVPVGERLYPLVPAARSPQAYLPGGLPKDATDLAASLKLIEENLARYTPSPILNAQVIAGKFTGQFEIEGKLAHYAQRVTTSTSDVQFFWLDEGVGGLQWPHFLNRYRQFWPEDLSNYALNLRSDDGTVSGSTLPILGDTVAVTLLDQDDPTEDEAVLRNATEFVVVPGADGVNRSLLLLRSGEGFWYLRVESILGSVVTDARYAEFFRNTIVDDSGDEVPLEAIVGERLTPPEEADSTAAWVDLSQGDAIDPTAYVNPFPKNITNAEKGAVIPVNASPTKGAGGKSNNELAVWWFERSEPPATAGDSFDPVFFPSHFSRYQLKWPQAREATSIVLASNNGSGDLDTPVAAGSIYIQNDPALIGYNPNEEHALLTAGRAYAIRDDLNFPETTSEAYTLVRYQALDGRPAMKVFAVLREGFGNLFNYPAVAGKVLQAPAPLSFLPLPLETVDGKQVSRNKEVTGANPDNAEFDSPDDSADYHKFTFEDRKGLKWVYRGPHKPELLTDPNNRPALGMQFYYKTQVGFAFPDATTGIDGSPELGTIVPYLRAYKTAGNPASGFDGDAKTGEPLTINYTPYWPDRAPGDPGERDEVPKLSFAQTLVKPTTGLPGLAGATSVEILYDQSTALSTGSAPPKTSAVLHDPTRRKISVLGDDLTAISGSIATSINNGRVYFQNLPPHLQQNFYLDPNAGPLTGPTPPGALVLQGEFKEEITDDSYLLLNVLNEADKATLKSLVALNDVKKAAWEAAIDKLSTTLEIFIENPDVPGTYVSDPAKSVDFKGGEFVRIINEDSAVDSYALTAVGSGSGYLTLILGNGEAFTDASEPVQMSIISIGDELYRGFVKPVTAANPLAEQVTMQHTGDFAAQTQNFDFQWFYAPPTNGQPVPVVPNDPDNPGPGWFRYGGNDQGSRVTFGGTQPLLTLADNYFIMRYRPKVDKVPLPLQSIPRNEQWSDWTEPALAEGWIKRVLAGINPFNQRLNDFYNNAVNTDVSLLTQAGRRWEGDVPLTLGSVQDAGLIEIYETLLRRAVSFTIDGTPAIDYAPANDALLLAAGYLNDLYVALGNEAFADASNPLIALDVDPSRLLQQQGLSADIGTTIQNTATARFAFEGQVPNLVSEELTLLRGRDDFLVPGARRSPVYNRFFWNFTRGIDAGEVIYAMNYNIRDKSGPDADGIINAADAARQYPQGHGDAYGHYLTAIKNYYRLLSDANFTWTPRVEAVNILGVPVTVDYQDERKLAAAGVALGRTASRILDLERRQLPTTTGAGWENLREARENTRTGVTRHWGAEDWASRAGQGNYLHWVTVNALLPEEDLANEGLQKIDRKNVPEVNEMAALAAQIQRQLDGANSRSNALGLTGNSMMFDLSPSDLAEGEAHFDQILARAKAALANAATAHARTASTNNLLRSIENQADDYSYTVSQEEIALENALLDVYGYAYNGDIGPGKLYPQGYAGPDFFKHSYINRPYVYRRDVLFTNADEGLVTDDVRTFTLPIYSDKYVELIAGLNTTTGYALSLEHAFSPDAKSPDFIEYQINLNDGPYQIATPEMGIRNYQGSIQDALSEVMATEEALYVGLNSMRLAQEAFKRKLGFFTDITENRNAIQGLEIASSTLIATREVAIGAIELVIEILDTSTESIVGLSGAASEAPPSSVGTAVDVGSPVRSAIKLTAQTAKSGIDISKSIALAIIYGTEVEIKLIELINEITISGLERDIELKESIVDLREAYDEMFDGLREIDAASIAHRRALEQYQNRLVDGDTVLAERETFRKRAAAVIQGARVRDVGFRSFRTESLEQYKILFDQAARYVYLAAKAYDYETGLLGTNQGEDFFAKIVGSRALGLVGPDGEPQFAGSGTGDPGLSSLLAQLEQDWNVSKGRLGINNPDEYGTLFSLRRELMELPFKEDGSDESHTAWQDALKATLVANLASDPDIAAHALPLANPDGTAQPGFVIEFSSTIKPGVNFFGKELVAGDSIFSTASFATKLNSVGVVFDGYEGMDPFASGDGGGEPTHNSENALSATPYVYLIPAGIERMRTPVLGSGEGVIRDWIVHDHAMPLPFDIGGSGADAGSVWTSGSTLSEPFFTPRKHQPFRAVNDPTLFYGRVPAEFTNSRLIGRSVWNGKWKLVIPASTLLADPEEGIERFAKSVKDIKLFMRTYSHSGN